MSVLLAEEAARWFDDLRSLARTGASCPVADVAAGFFRDGFLVAHGFNGVPFTSAMDDCEDAGCAWIAAGEARTGRDHARHLHAEVAAVADAAFWGQRIGGPGTEVIVTLAPCPTCALVLLAVGVERLWIPDTTPGTWEPIERVLVASGMAVERIPSGVDGAGDGVDEERS